MSTAIFANNKSTLRVVLSFSVCVGLILLALITFPARSGAKLQTSTTAAPVTKAKRTRQPFVPGEVLVRYRSESMAQARGFTLVEFPVYVWPELMLQRQSTQSQLSEMIRRFCTRSQTIFSVLQPHRTTLSFLQVGRQI